MLETAWNGVYYHRAMNVSAVIDQLKTRPAWRERSRYEKGSLLFLVLFAFFCPVSIGGAQISSALAMIMLLMSRPWRRRVPSFAPVIVPLILFIVFSLLAVLFSTNPMESLWNARNLLLFLAMPLTAWIVRWEDDARALVIAVCAGGALTTIWGVVNIFLGRGGGESHLRLTGTLGHYMTAGGELMIIALLIGAIALFSTSGSSRRWAIAATAVMTIGLAMTQTRNAYLGFAAGLIVVLFIWRKGLVFLLPFVLSTAVLISPPIIRDRVFQITDLKDESVRNRFAMMATGQRMVADYPLFGVGLQQVQRLYNHYKSADDPGNVPHLHNNFFQIAAERGIPALIAWIILIGSLSLSLMNLIRVAGATSWLRGASAGALAAIAALLIAGLFEYNFGDSEVLMLFLLFTSVPFGLAAHAHSGENR